MPRPKCDACGSGMDAWGCVKCGGTITRKESNVALQGPKEDHRAAELKSVANAIITVFPDAAATLRAIAADLETEILDG